MDKASPSGGEDCRGEYYDLCYHLPENGLVRGRRMNCDSLSIMKDLNLLDDNMNSIQFVDLQREAMPQPVFVTAFSSNHFDEGKRLISAIRSVLPNQLILVYDLGLTTEQAEFIQELCYVKYQRFNFSKYPPYVLCALEEECMGGNYNLQCSFDADRYGSYANCHRYDQSIINILLANQYFYDAHYYASEITDHFDFQRFVSEYTANFTCG
ncbi:unnamed protein product [Anisakis simplex]|uniref:Peptidase_C25 domain-containing protein n=1 Tax=Anisakis simplex TaxID=6269 RepID=A0A0M3K1L1_ANISI|nr:unnamed protein product [Anisakis simplex]